MDENSILMNPNYTLKLFEIDLDSYSLDEITGKVNAAMNLSQFTEGALTIPLKPMIFHELFLEHGDHFLPKFEFQTINNEKDILLPA